MTSESHTQLTLLVTRLALFLSVTEMSQKLTFIISCETDLGVGGPSALKYIVL